MELTDIYRNQFQAERGLCFRGLCKATSKELAATDVTSTIDDNSQIWRTLGKLHFGSRPGGNVRHC